VSAVAEDPGRTVAVPLATRDVAPVLPRLVAKWDTLVALTMSDVRARYGRGPWRLVKWLLDPFAAVGVYLLLVTFVLNRPGTAPGLTVACAVVPFQLVMLSVVNANGAIRLRRSIILNGQFDRTLIPVASVLTETLAFAASIGLLALTMVGYRISPSMAILWLPVVLALNMVFALSWAYPSALMGLWFPDLRVFTVSFVRTLFFLAPGLIALADVHGRTHDLLRLNPLTGLFEAYRAVLLYGHRPEAWTILYPLGFSLVLVAIFLPIFIREQRHFAKVVE
jgi:lipopolysaccharide transport system permease protein